MAGNQQNYIIRPAGKGGPPPGSFTVSLAELAEALGVKAPESAKRLNLFVSEPNGEAKDSEGSSDK